MLLRHSHIAVAIVIALSAAAATTQVFAADDDASDSAATPCGLGEVLAEQAWTATSNLLTALDPRGL